MERPKKDGIEVADPRQVVEFLRELNRLRDLDSLAQWILEYAVKAVPGAQAGSFLVLNEELGMFEYRAAVGWDIKELSRIRIPKDQTLQAKLGYRGPTIVRRPGDLGRDALPPQVQKALERFPLAAFITFPIVFQGEVIAYFNVDSLEDSDAFSEDDIIRLAPLAEEIALAVALEREREQARQRELTFHTVWDRLTDAIFITDFQGRILECNPSAEKQTGYSREELLRMNIIEDLTAEGPAVHYAMVNERLARGETVVFQERKRRKDGTTYWTECAVVQFEYKGRPATISVNRDITDRKRLEEELKRRVEELRAVNRALQLIPAKLELDEVVEDVVAVARETTGAEFAGLILFDEQGKPLRAITPPGSPPIPLRLRPRGFLSWVLKNKRPLLIHEVREDGTTDPPVTWPNDPNPTPVNPLLLELGIKSLAMVPALHAGKVVAVLSLHSFNPRNFDHQRGLLAALAPQIAIALENAMLYESTRESERRWRHLFEESPVSLWVEDFSEIKNRLDSLRGMGVEDLEAYLEGHPEFIDEVRRLVRVVEVNNATLRLFGADHPEEIQEHLNEIIPEEVAPLFREELVSIWEGRSQFEGMGINRTLDGRTIHVHIRWRVFPGHERDYSRVLVSLVDLTPQVEAQERLRGYAEKLAALHRVVRELQHCHSEEEVCQVAVEGAASILGFPLCVIALVEGDQLVPVAWVGEIEPQPLRRGIGLAWRTLEEGRSFWGNVPELPGAQPADPRIQSALSVPIGKLGNLQGAALEPDVFTEDEVRLAEILAAHVNEGIQRVRLERELQEQSIRDPLTGLYNRRHLMQVLEEEVRRGKRYKHPFAVMIVDLDNFKLVNDRYGHLKGDDVLAGVADLLRASVRESDLLFRCGGDEFVIVLPETDGQTRRVAARLRRRLARWAKDQGLDDIGLGLSVGTAVWDPEAPVEAEELLQRADSHLYRAKRRKKRAN